MRIGNHFILSQEAIDFQTRAFGRELEMVIGEIRASKLKDKVLEESEFKGILKGIIKKYTGTNIMLTLASKVSEACIYIPTFDRNHPFIQNCWRDFYDLNDTVKIFDSIKKVAERNTVSLKTGMCTGIFAELPVDVHFHFPKLFAMGMTDGEIIAVMLHEIGHLFTTFEMLSQTNTTNLILASLFRTIAKKDTAKVKEYVFEEAGKLLGDRDAFKDLTEQENLKVVSTVVFKTHTKWLTSEIGSDIYDGVSCEQAADNYATRMGYGRELILGLDKLHKAYGHPSTSRGTAVFISIFTSIIDIGKLMFGVVLMFLPGAQGMGVIIVLMAMATLLFSGETSSFTGYDKLKDRYLRIKEQMIQRLKDRDITKEETQSILESLKTTEKIISDATEVRTVFNVMADYLFSKDAKARKVYELQRQLEALASNELFAKAAQFKYL